MPGDREVAGRRQRHADDATLGGGVGELADLAVERRDRRGVDDHASLPVGERLAFEICDASWVRHRNVPTRLIPRTRSHSLRMCGVPSLPIVRTAVPVPAQLTPTRSGAVLGGRGDASATCSRR